ncbi:alpha/beta fold hydrolase [Oceanispirochaeta crateris]|uniref:Alpha/beta fold hydrolase n=1 Tax=Oceanispirochaeta crateris TaxID=2518645 RepID=A0A5C1QIL0_9SPIO|nr:alpha/beta fold hydrolase [Oceanispirochaeta crateris]QEN08005.1 alpha/beta fold hydrolase [Oceanispirochaeta crateris]
MNLIRRALLLIPFFSFFTIGFSLPAKGQTDSRTEDSFGSQDISAVKEQMTPLENHNTQYFPETLAFLAHYSADQVPGPLEFGWFLSEERKIAAYLFRTPGEPAAGTVYLLHGYLDHSLSNTGVIRFLVEHNYNVAAFDLPGHGMSEGVPVDIDDFSEYAFCLKRFKALTESSLEGPFFALGHSTGSSVILEYTNLYENDFKALILTSPLVKNFAWRLTALGLFLGDPFMDDIKRRFGGSSSNEEFEYFTEHNDPLQSQRIPFHWIYANTNWIKRMEQIPPREDLVFHILQGRKDTVVDYRHNIPFLMEKYPHSDVIYYDEGEHSLFNEIPALRHKVYQDILTILELKG